MREFWTPSHKYELVEWLSTYFPKDKVKFKRMRKGQLYAIYFSVRWGLVFSKNENAKVQDCERRCKV